MNNIDFTNQTDFADSLEQLLQVLNPKEKQVIIDRFGLNKSTSNQTLESIGKSLGITRERVRQIEKSALQKLQRTIHANKLSIYLDYIEQHLKNNNYFQTQEDLVNEISEKISQSHRLFNSLIVLLLEIHTNIQKVKKTKKINKSWVIKDKLTSAKVKEILKIGEQILNKKKEPIQPLDFLNLVQKDLKSNKKGMYSRKTLNSIFEASTTIKQVSEGFGLTTWRTICPKSIKDKSIIIFKRISKPLHFSEVCKQIHEAGFDPKKVTLQAVHNELIRYDEFVLIGRGIYALKEWGFKTGTVKDIIFDILSENGPLSKSKIIEEVLKERKVKIGTISLNLQKHPEFKRVGRAVYSV